ncbi:MAG TPA: hypothetical protein DCW42_09970 [Bacteroidetes bacterium]|nr:hypothetical protein [Bacteroidota bacterium]
MEKLISNIKFKINNFYIWFLDLTAPYFSKMLSISFRNYWISHSAKRIYKKITTSKIEKEKFSYKWFDVHQPNKWYIASLISFAFVFFPQLLGVAILLIFQNLNWTFNFTDNRVMFLETAWQVLASLTGITFVIIIFIVEISNKDRNERKAMPVFFSETWAILTASFSLLVILSMGNFYFLFSNFVIESKFLSIFYFWNSILFGINILLILNIFIRTIKILPKSIFLFKTSPYLHRIVFTSMQDEIIERISENYSQLLMKEMELDYPYFEPDPPDNKIYINLSLDTEQTYIVSDINIKLIKIAINNAKRIHKEYKNNDIIYFGKLSHRLSKEKPGISLINPILNHPSVICFLKNSSRISTDVIKKSQLNEAFIDNRNMIFRSLKNQEIDNVLELLNLYAELIVTFMELFHSYNIKLHENSLTKNYKIFSDWTLIDTIFNQYRSLIPHFLDFNDKDLIRKFLNLPLEIMGNALIYKDRFIYQKSSSLFLPIYIQIHFVENESTKKAVKDFIFIRLREHRMFTLSPRVRYSQTNIELIKIYKIFFFDLLITWNNLIKKTIDFRSIDDFSRFIHEAKNLSFNFLDEIKEDQVALLQLKLVNKNDVPEKEKIIDELSNVQKLIHIKGELLNSFQKMVLGFGGWITHLFETKKIESQLHLEYNIVLNHYLTDLDVLFSAYLFILPGVNFSDLFNWDSWEMQEAPDIDNEVSSFFLQINNLIDKFFIIRSIELFVKNIGQTQTFPQTDRIKEIYDNSKRISDELLKSELWVEYFKNKGVEDFEERVEQFLAMLNDSKNQYDNLVDRTIIESELDLQSINKIKLEVKDAWKKSTIFRNLVTKIGSFQEILNSRTEENDLWGYKKLYPKNAFIKQKRITYMGIGETIGNGIAHVEDKYLYNQIFNNSAPIYMKTFEVEELLVNYICEMEQENMKPIIFFNGRNFFKKFNNSKQFNSAWQIKNNPLADTRIFGVFNNHPVIQLFSLPQNHICLIDINKIGILRQYLLKDNEPLDIRISELTKEEAEKIIDDNPNENIDSKTGKTLSREERITNLLLDVKVEVYENCRFEDINPNAARIIVIKDEDIDNNVE